MLIVKRGFSLVSPDYNVSDSVQNPRIGGTCLPHLFLSFRKAYSFDLENEPEVTYPNVLTISFAFQQVSNLKKLGPHVLGRTDVPRHRLCIGDHLESMTPWQFWLSPAFNRDRYILDTTLSTYAQQPRRRHFLDVLHAPDSPVKVFHVLISIDRDDVCRLKGIPC